MLKAVGWWISSLMDEGLPAPQEFVGELPRETRMQLTRHLNRGLHLVQYRGYSWCRFGCGIKDFEMGSWDLTDGLWVWPQGLAHYVEVHGIVLPEEFVSHVLSEPVPMKPDPPPMYDFNYWTDWSSARRKPIFKDGLRIAASVARERMTALIEEKVSVIEREHAVSSNQCVWRGCSRKALIECFVCAEHLLGKRPTSPEAPSLLTELRRYLWTGD